MRGLVDIGVLPLAFFVRPCFHPHTNLGALIAALVPFHRSQLDRVYPGAHRRDNPPLHVLPPAFRRGLFPGGQHGVRVLGDDFIGDPQRLLSDRIHFGVCSVYVASPNMVGWSGS